MITAEVRVSGRTVTELEVRAFEAFDALFGNKEWTLVDINARAQVYQIGGRVELWTADCSASSENDPLSRKASHRRVAETLASPLSDALERGKLS